MIFEGIEVNVSKGDVLYVPEGMKHQLIPSNYHEEKTRLGFGTHTLEALRITVPFFDSKDEFVIEEQV